MYSDNPAFKKGPYGQCPDCRWVDLELSGFETKSLRCPVCKERFEASGEAEYLKKLAKEKREKATKNFFKNAWGMPGQKRVQPSP